MHKNVGQQETKAGHHTARRDGLRENQETGGANRLAQPIRGQPSLFGGECLAATIKRPQDGAEGR